MPSRRSCPQHREGGLVVVGLLGANVAAYVFFFLQVQLQRAIDRSRIGEMLSVLADRVANSVLGVLQLMHHDTGSAGLIVEADIIKADVERLFAAVSPYANASMATRISADIKTLNWLEALVRHDDFCREAITQIWRFVPFLDSKLVQLLFKIEESSYAYSMKDLRDNFLPFDVKLTNTTLDAWSDNYWPCYQDARELRAYAAKMEANLSGVVARSSSSS